MAHRTEDPVARPKPRPETGSLDSPYTLADLGQVRALADPLRLRILSTLGEERTTKQVAQILGEKPTRLYHHVAALERAGLVRLARKRPNRGTVEKYYVAVACAFRADPRLFSPSGARGATSAVSSVISSALDTTASEIGRLLSADTGDSAVAEEGVLTFLEVRAAPAEVRRIRTRLKRLVDGLGRKGGGVESPVGERRYRLTIAYFPLDAEERARSRR
jgi:DNA-binding transcriptional ArsR family regulator